MALVMAELWAVQVVLSPRLAEMGGGCGVNLIDQVVIIDRLRKTRYTTTYIRQGRASSVVVPGFWVDVAWLWKAELPEPQACLQAIRI